MAFQNSILAAVVLLREAIQSPNYVSGVSGWTINQDGTAEFADLVIRSSDGSNTTVSIANGKITITNGAAVVLVEIDASGYRLYNTSGDLVAYIALDTGGALGGFYCRNFTGGTTPPVYAFLSGGELTSGPVTNSQADIHGHLQYVLDTTSNYAVQTLSTGLIDTAVDDEARVQLISQTGVRSVVWVDGGSSAIACDLAVTGDAGINGAVLTGTTITAGTSLHATTSLTTGTGATIGGSLTANNLRWGHADTPAPGVGGGTSTVAVTFATAMPNTPRITITPTSTVDPGTVTIRAYVDSISTAGFTIRAFRSTNSGTGFDWHAIST